MASKQHPTQRHPQGCGKIAVAPPPWKIKKNFRYMCDLFATFSPCGGFFCHAFLYMEAFFAMWGPFRYYFLYMGVFSCLYGGLSVF